MIWPQVVSTEKATFGVGVILRQLCCYVCHDYDCNLYLKLCLSSNTWCLFWLNFGLLLHILSAQAPYKFLETLKIKADFSRSSAYFSLYTTHKFLLLVNIYVIHRYKAKHLLMFLASCSQNCQLRKPATLGVWVTLNKPCCYSYQSSGGNIFFLIKHYLRQLSAAFGASITSIKR